MSREWITNEIWDALIDTVWGIEEWQNKSRKARQNRLTPKEGSIPKHTGGSVPFVVHAKRMEMYNSVLSQKYGEASSAQSEFDPHAWIEAIGGMETTCTHVYGFGTRVPVTALLNGTQSNAATSESACGPINANVTSPAIALEEKVKNLSNNLDKIHEEIREEIKNAMSESMSEFMACMEPMIVTNAISKQGNAGTSSLNIDK
ncbi:uncharacterized protein LOC110410507 isoform X2 [Herrania umbratica]|uniref:Uncharacterized protein LOC110410507 isoform X2 n=1 Tax=Herrania umbratica TaxID=108875 RepID=A0A6J0ZM15_9ROSI|nr:uncharacterized protein LOC110410507 isoform X2 [Herrania umbratica]